MKKKIMIAMLAVFVLSLVATKYFTDFLDSRESAIIIGKDFEYADNYQDKEVLSRSADNIFIGEVIEESGDRKAIGGASTQFSVRITQNLKGALIGDVTINQMGGYYKEKGKLYLLQYENDSMLQPGQMYVFAVNRNKPKNWYNMVPKYGKVPVKTEQEKYRLIKEFKRAIDKN
ncbi:hypothetical protein [Mesobacillus zeae]|uniref:Uncharacterized protein n=1 Tax=Mesobacillus zeae TaxID=1917180 RepID=A0A398BF24_9BACI|nr:hypothetical protein [Mesobacillus zeae]RID86280.1 hypothetical protein D1970_07065 [Mesobacillus zeae]